MIKKEEINFYLTYAGKSYDKSTPELSEAGERIKKNLCQEITKISTAAAEIIFNGKYVINNLRHAIAPNDKQSKFRSYLHARISPQNKYSPLVQYWFRIDGKTGLLIIGIGLKDTAVSDNLKQRANEITNSVKMEASYEVKDSISNESIIQWIVNSINGFDISYEEFCKKLQPHLDDELSKWSLKKQTSNDEDIESEEMTLTTNSNEIPLNQILYGPPGTGKTFNTINHALSIADLDFQKETKLRKEIKERFDQLIKEGKIVFTTFHQSMSYEDFIEGIKPDTNKNGAVTYEVKSGIFKALCDSAKKDTNKNYVLIIDEINRGNVSQIFGELITLIEDDKRLGKSEGITITLPYSKKEFGVPSNVFIIGTMNTADRSVEALDAALRRRFSFIEMPPKPDLIKTEGKLKEKAGILDVGDLGSIDLANLLEVINKRIEKLLDSDHQIGHSFFLPVSSISSLKEVFQNKIIPLLKEYFYGDFGKLGLVLGKGFFEPIETSSSSSFANFEDFDSNDLSERVIYKLKNISSDDELSGMNNNDFFEAINKLLNK